jgi:ribosome biogenesis GTPase
VRLFLKLKRDGYISSHLDLKPEFKPCALKRDKYNQVTLPNGGQGLIVTRFGSQAMLEDKHGQTVRTKVRRKLEHLVCGDEVTWEKTPANDIVVTEILPRRNTLTRTYFRGTPRTIAANIDQLLVICAPQPEPDWSVIDNLLVAAERMKAEAIIVYNKTDLHSPKSDQIILDDFQKAGYKVLKTSTQNPESIVVLQEKLNGKTSIFVGQSGMGKSSLTNQLIPGIDAQIKSLSETSGLGQHTTSVTQRYSLPNNGGLIDSPGIRDFTPLPLAASEYQYGFIEFKPHLAQCRFHNCLHSKEPGCAVKAAVKTGDISQRRFDSYLSLLKELDS